MKDLYFQEAEPSDKLTVQDTSIYKARNILSTEINYLAYAPTFGIDYNVFFGDDYEIQTETFKSYAVQKLSENGVNPLDVLSKEDSLDTILKIQLAT